MNSRKGMFITARTGRDTGTVKSAAEKGAPKYRVREKDFMQRVIDLGRLNGWLVYHTFDSRRSEPGFPDLCMVRDGKLLFAELKTDRGRLSPVQEAWLTALALAGVETRVWRPRDWYDVELTLRRRERKTR